jgi:very-short-patch-repair endonuclease
MNKQYASGERDRFEITKGMNDAFRKKVATGWLPNPNPEGLLHWSKSPEGRAYSRKHMTEDNPATHPEVRVRMTASYKKTMLEHPERHPNVIMAQKGFSSSIERRMKKLLEQAHIPFVQQHPILCYFVDFAIPELKIAIECDGHYWHNPKSKREQNRQHEIEAEGWMVVRFTENQINKQMDEVAEKVLRVAANHSGQYGFVPCEIVKVETTRRTCATLYNLSVEQDESFLAKGIIVHNCRCALVGELSEEKMVSLKGDEPGHPFRGNQYTGGEGAGGEAVDETRPYRH